jgi:predicted PurR-regulated permease PerM
MSFPQPTPQQARILWLALTGLAVAILVALVGVLFLGAAWLVDRLSSVLLPLAIAGILACLLDPVVDLLQVRLRIPRARAILMVFFLGLMLVLALLATVVPRLIVETDALLKQLPQYTDTLRLKLDDFMKHSPLGLKLKDSWRQSVAAPQPAAASSALGTSAPTNAIGLGATKAAPAPLPAPTPGAAWDTEFGRTVLSWLASALPTIGNWLLARLSQVASWAGLVLGLALAPIYVFYFLLQKEGIKRNWTDYLPIRESKLKEEVVFVLTAINDCLIVFFRGQVLVSLCSGTLLTIGFSILGLHYALLLGAIAALLGIVPYLGVMISLVPAVALAIVQFGDWWHPVLVLAIFGLVQLIEGLVVSPKIIGNRVGLHPLTVIIAVMTGTTLLGGILGGVLAIPLTAALRTLMFRYVWKRKLTRAG